VRHLESASDAGPTKPKRIRAASVGDTCSKPHPALHGRHDGAGDWEFESTSLQERVRCELGPQTTAAFSLGCRIRLPIPAKPDLPLAPEHLDKTELRYGQNDRAIALNRKNALFAGHDAGAENWACLASLIETCKLSGVDPQAYH
jgi:hypothetical protein